MDTPSTNQEHRRAISDLRSHLVVAGDGKVREIVALVDSMSERGAADMMIEPLRRRLTQLRPPRRLGLSRFIFLPADPVIVAPAQWRRGALTIPRSALACLVKVTRASFGSEEAVFASAVDGLMSGDHAAVVRVGRMIWPRAAAFLAQTHVPPEWAGMTGLSTQDFIFIARSLSVLLGESVAIEQMLPVASYLDELSPRLHASLSRAHVAVSQMPSPENATCAGRCLSMMLAVLLARMPEAEALLIATTDFAARHGDSVTRLAADGAVDAIFDQAESHLAQPGGTISVDELARVAMLIRAIEEPGPASRPSHKPRAAALRRVLDTHCRNRFEADLASGLLRHIPQLDATSADDMVVGLEEAALNLRKLEGVGRSLGVADHYERALAEAAESLLKLAQPAARTVDLARLSEILLGPEAGLALFDGAAK